MLTAAADLGLIKIMKSMKNLRIAMVAVLAMLMLPLGLSAQKKAEKDAFGTTSTKSNAREPAWTEPTC